MLVLFTKYYILQLYQIYRNPKFINLNTRFNCLAKEMKLRKKICVCLMIKKGICKSFIIKITYHLKPLNKNKGNYSNTC